MSEDVFIGNKTDILSINRYIYGNNNPLKFKDPDGFVPIYIQNQNANSNGREPLIMKHGDEEYFVRNGAEPVYSKNGNNYYITSGDIVVKEVSESIMENITSTSIPAYRGNGPYAVDDIYKLPTISTSNPSTKYIKDKTPIGNVTVMAGVGFGGKATLFTKETGWQFRYAAEKDLLHDKQLRGVLNLEQIIAGNGYSFNRDYINNKIDNSGRVFFLKQNHGGDLIASFGIEAYLGIGGGLSFFVNLSELCRRAKELFAGNTCKD